MKNITTTTLLLISFLWSSVPAAQAQRARTLEAIIHTPLKSTATTICRSKGGNLLLQVQLSIYHCYNDLTIAQKQAKVRR
jgi:hypothetical protein